MNIFTVIANLAGAAALLGVKVPPAITNTIVAAAPVVAELGGAAPSVSAPSPSVTALLAAGLQLVASSGNTQADALVASALGEISQYQAQVSSYEAGQPVIIATATVSIKGVSHKTYTIEALDTSELVQGLGL